MLAHVVGENSSVNSGCDFRCAGGFCPVTDNTADVSNGIDDRQANILIGSAGKIGNGGAGSTACADGATVSGKTSNIFFLIFLTNQYYSTAFPICAKKSIPMFDKRLICMLQ